MIRARELDSRAVLHVRYEIERAKGFRTLSTLLLELPLENGKCRAFLPESASDEQVYDFAAGGILSISDQREETEILMTEVLSFVHATPGNVCIFEDRVSHPDDANLCHNEVKWNSMDDEVYVIVGRDYVTLTPKTVNYVAAWDFVACFASLPDTAQIPRAYSAIDRGFLAAVAERTRRLVVSAYDMEGHVWWVRE